MHERRSSLLTFDKISRGFFFLDYLLGTKVRFPHVAEIESIQEAVAGHEHLAVMEAFQHRGALAERERSYSGEALHALDRIEFGSDMEHWFVRQDYLLEALQRALREIPASIGAGYFHLVGPAGSGKSWFAHGLCDPHVFPLAPQVISYHVRIGLRQNPELFMEALCEQVRRPDGHNVRGARIRLEELDRPAAALAAFLADVLARSCQDGIILLLDGLDEVLEPPSAGELSIVDFLPDPDELPEGVVVVLTSRPDSECRPRARACLGRFAGVPTGYQRFDIHDHPQEQEGTLRHYLEARHHLKDAVMERVVHGCRGSFLVAKLLGRIYALSRQNDDIFFPSELQQVYSTYLGLIRHEVGEHLFDSLHRRLLSLVAVSPRALSLEEMADFLGLQEERLLFALFDAGEFFAVIRDEPANMFSVSHVEFSQYVLVNQADDAASRLREIVETFRAEEDVLGWLVDANALLAQSGHTQLSMFLSQLLLNLCPQSYAGRTTILSQYIDMVHITGNYRKAAELLADLATTLQEGEHLPPDHRSVVRAQLRRAHHLKFVADVATVRAILQPLMEHLAPDHPDRPEVEFMFYGSLGCLDDPGAAELEGLQMIAEGCRRREDLYLLTRCLRRIADLLLLLGRDDEALQAVDEAQEIAGASASRQAVYLNCTLAEIHRHRGELEAGIRCHRIGLELASQKGLMGWKGHAELGLAETWRMQGSRDMADAFLARAQLSYEAADHQGWGLIHVAISRALLHEDRPSLDRATREAARLGYRRDVEYGRRLLALALLPTTAHGAHFLLFP